MQFGKVCACTRKTMQGIVTWVADSGETPGSFAQSPAYGLHPSQLMQIPKFSGEGFGNTGGYTSLANSQTSPMAMMMAQQPQAPAPAPPAPPYKRGGGVDCEDVAHEDPQLAAHLLACLHG